MMPLLQVDELSVSYGEHRALRGVSLTVEEGEIVALIGANGAGKSTTLRALSGLLPHGGGRIVFGGEEITRSEPRAIVERHLIHCPEGRQVFGRLTVQENLLVGAPRQSSRRAIREDAAEVYALFPRLAERRRQQARTLSGGEQQMLALGRALMAKPRLLMLDEPSLGLAPNLVASVFQVVAGLNRRGVTILLVEQNARMALSTANRAYVLEVGSIVLSGTGQALLQDSAVRSAYLGGL
ncbi:MAG: ABC transporter ATP-binding protein [Spirochaetales bacterium]|nr:ABC transporter ATP-binding protein [Spirochaetales bacterium]